MTTYIRAICPSDGGFMDSRDNVEGFRYVTCRVCGFHCKQYQDGSLRALWANWRGGAKKGRKPKRRAPYVVPGARAVNLMGA